MADEKPGGERVAVVEAILEKHVLPMLQKMDGKLDDIMAEKASKESVKEAHDAIDALKVAMEGKADKSEVQQVRERVFYASGAVALGVVVMGWLVPFLLDKLVK